MSHEPLNSLSLHSSYPQQQFNVRYKSDVRLKINRAAFFFLLLYLYFANEKETEYIEIQKGKNIFFRTRNEEFVKCIGGGGGG